LIDIKRKLDPTDLVFVTGASKTTPDILNHIRQYCNGCLIILG
jgi:hypothetical protein